MLSSLLTPFRWYAKYHQLNKFDNDCKSVCDFELITDKRHLLPFQFTRDKVPHLITDWVLRPCCNHTFDFILNKAQSNFVEGTGWVVSGDSSWVRDCNNMAAVTTVASGTIQMNPVLTPGKTYWVVFTITDYKNVSGPPVFLQISENGNVINNYQSSGVKKRKFTATGTSFEFNFINAAPGDIVKIDDVQIYEDFSIAATDIVLDETQLSLFNTGDKDVISYCGADLGVTIPPGCYYSVIKTNKSAAGQAEQGLYFSEVITVKDFVPEKSPYLILDWYNTCDIGDVVYQAIGDYCQYKNKLYLPISVLTRPDYPIKDEGEQDGNQTFNPTFQKFQKVLSLFAVKVPEYIVDSLSAMFLHDTITYTTAVRDNQDRVDDAIEIKSVESDVQYIFNDCFANVELKLTLNDLYVDETCCNNNSAACHQCQYTIPELNVYDEDYDYALMLNPGGSDPEENGLYQLIDEEWTLITPEVGALICEDVLPDIPDSGSGFWQYDPTYTGIGVISGYFFAPTIQNSTFQSGTTWKIEGQLISQSFGQMQYSLDGGTTWINIGDPFTQAEYLIGVNITLVSGPQIVRVLAYDINGCQYGASSGTGF
jgi:hypothetical protein